MAEVLAEEEKYINCEEALMSKRGSSSVQKEKSKEEKKRDRSPRRRRDRDRFTEEQRIQRSISKDKR